MPVRAASASLYLSPNAGSYTIGNTFSVEIKLNSGGVAINAADGTLVFNPDKIEVKSISKAGSVFSLWVQEPAFSNSLGTIIFAGGKPSPGFTGASGIIMTITFKAKASGTANLSFASGSILADDGLGTNVLSNLGSGSYQFSAREITPVPLVEEPAPQAEVSGPPLSPIVSSKTHPDENKWYSNNNPEFSWKISSDVTGVSLLLNQKPASNPGSISDGLAESKKFENSDDGIWYFHVKFRNQYGWGAITHRKVLIDTKPPEPFEITVDKKGDDINPSPTLFFEAKDALSGIEYYEIEIAKNERKRLGLADLKYNFYQLLPQPPGTHLIEIKAFDKAGNFTTASTKIDILSISVPIITEYPKSLNPEEKLVLGGESLTDVTILVFVQEKGKEPVMSEVQSTKEGNWSFTSSEPLSKGEYTAWVKARNNKGALSFPSDKVSFAVGLPSLLKIGVVAVGYFTVISVFLVLIAILAFTFLFIRYKISMWRKRVKKETKDLIKITLTALRALREEVNEQIEYLDGKKGLTGPEKKVRDKLQKALDLSERYIDKEIKDIEKEIK
ncbi:MAG: cohesin domain-containing protein [bacterium]|nr:cohesin domain-containing protein [bacterium]